MKYSLLLALCVYSFSSFGQYNKNVNLTDFIRDLQIWQKDDKEMALTFWIPQSYWDISLKGSPDVEESQIAELNSIFEGYIFICALDMELLPGGNVTYTSEKNIRRSISLIAPDGNSYLPLKEKDIPDKLQNMSNVLKPMFSKILGQMGEGIQFYFFEVKDVVGKELINELKSGQFTVKHSNREFVYNLPIVSLLESKHCPEDGAEMKGNWNFCPIHGVKLNN